MAKNICGIDSILVLNNFEIYFEKLESLVQANIYRTHVVIF